MKPEVIKIKIDLDHPISELKEDVVNVDDIEDLSPVMPRRGIDAESQCHLNAEDEEVVYKGLYLRGTPDDIRVFNEN